MYTLTRVFISYRAEEVDSASVAGRLQDRLADALGGVGNVFMDVGSLTPGSDFAAAIRDSISQCDLFLTLIGPQWESILAERSKKSVTDYVRLEIAMALDRSVTVVPVLVNREAMPERGTLSVPLDRILNYHAVQFCDRALSIRTSMP